MKKNYLRFLIFFLLFAMLMTVGVSAESDSSSLYPYEAYVYDNDNNPVEIPLPYKTEKVITGEALGVGVMNDVNDIFYGNDGNVYVCDSGNNRIIITDGDFKNSRVIAKFDNNGIEDSLNEPTGLFLSEDTIYVADSENARIVLFDRKNYTLKAVFNKPKISQLGDDYNYSPNKVAVDRAGRIYVIAAGINQGLICLNEKGEFSSFLGAPQVEPNFLEIIERRFASKEKRKNMESYVPTEYTSLSIDDNGFIYVASLTSKTVPVGMINSDGNNVMTKLKNDLQYGDLAYVENSSTSFSDVALRDDGSYFVVDSSNGKVYAYTADGQMLYAFGAIGSQKGTYYTARSIEFKDDQLLVADSAAGTITVYSPTDFEKKISNAFLTYYDGDYDKSDAYWNEVYNQCTGYIPAVIGIAKNCMRRGEYKQAARMLRSVKAYEEYNIAFEEQRSEILKDVFPLIIIGIIVLIIAFFVLKYLQKKYEWFKKIKSNKTVQKLTYSKYVIFHPFDGFWDIKHEKRGNMTAAIIILGIFSLLYAIRTQFSGYIITKTNSSEINSLYSLSTVLLTLILYVISNWCFTTLMDGKGNMRDIIIATSYSLTPYIILSVPLFALSHIMTVDEAVFYYYINTFSWIWVIAILFFGMMTTHDYSLSKAILTAVLTLIGMCLIIFIILLAISVVQQVFVAFYNVYKELSFRTY